MPSRAEILGALIKVIGTVSRRGLAPTGSTRPIDDCGLESADGVEIADAIEDELGVKVPDDENPFFEENGGRKRTRTIDQIADWLYTHCQAE